MKTRRSQLATIGVTAAVTAAATVFARNFISGEKKVKQQIIDELGMSVGSANLNNRSFRLNNEANLNIIDREIAEGETRAFEEDKSNSQEVTHRDLQQRPLEQKIADASAALFRSQL
ncbi:MAG: phospholipase D-like domain-containing protein [Verrucomicrobiota bacterium]|nr:phospholipase D-like domain-containing protein [Verrucomicrobiota bacterium]